uniref:Coiled-coil SMC6 And NSE5 INteracting (CANIN) domain-containing protein n=1 Tax=Clytia hemisphaerica TaxID=252671 RepID=A0A7M5XLZ5_9CNID
MATLSDEELNSASSESEDDLPTLSTIMTKSPSRKQPAIKTADEVLTPRRTKKHTDNDELVLGSPLRSPTTSRVRNTKSKARSLNDLLKDKAKDDDIQSKVDDIMKMKEMELDDYGENSEEKCDRNAIGELYGDYSQEFSQDVDVLDDSNDSIEVKFSYALSRDFPDTFPGIELFVRPADDVDPVMLLEGLLEYFEDESIGISKADLVDEDLSRENVHEIIGQIVGDLSCQTEMKERDLWCKIWKILCFVEDCEVCYAAYECLSSHFKMCSKNSISPPWIPSVIELLESIIGIGASPSIVSTIEYVYPELDTSIFESLDCSGEEQFVNARAIRKDIHRRLYTVQFITKLFTVAVQTFPGQYNVDELRAIFMLVSHLSVDKLFQSVLIDFKVLLASILDTYNDEAMWETEVENLVRDFLSLDWHHRNLLQGVESVLTSTKRGFHFQQVLAINVAIKIIKDREKKNQSEGGESETDDMDEEKGRKIFSNYPVKV